MVGIPRLSGTFHYSIGKGVQSSVKFIGSWSVDIIINSADSVGLAFILVKSLDGTERKLSSWKFQ